MSNSVSSSSRINRDGGFSMQQVSNPFRWSALGLIAGVTLVSGSFAFASTITLRDSISFGLEQSDVLAAQRHSFVASRQAISQARAGKELSAKITLSDSELQRDATNVSGGFKSRFSRTGSLVFSKTLADFGETDLRVLVARQTVAGEKARYRSVEQNVIMSVISAHLDVITARQKAEIRASNVERLYAQKEAAQVRSVNGSATLSDVAETEARLARAHSEKILSNSLLINAEEAYLSLTGVFPEGLAMPVIPSDLTSSLSVAENLAAEQHPDILSAMASEKGASLQFPLLQATVKPTIDLSLSASTMDQTGTSADKDELLATVTFTTPILVTDSTRSLAREALSLHSQARLTVAEARRTARLNVRNAFRAFKASQGQLDAVRAEIKAAQLLVDNAFTEVEFGVKTFLDQMDAEQNLSNSKLRLVQTKQAVLMNAFTLLQATGGLNPDLFDLAEKSVSLDSIPNPSSRYPYMVPFLVGE